MAGRRAPCGRSIAFFSTIRDGPSDGKVSVERTKVAGMRDFVEVPHWHPLLMTPRDVDEQILYFLDNGRFRR